MKTFKFNDMFKPEEDPDFSKYKNHLFTLLGILDPFIQNKITDEEDVLEEIHSLLACFAMYVFKDGMKNGRKIDN